MLILIETVQNKFCKRHLGVRKNTNTCLVLGECGRLPLSVTYFVNCIQYLCKLLMMPNNRFPKQCYNMLTSIDNAGRNCWATNVKSLIFRYGFGFVWISQDVGNVDLFVYNFRQRVIDCVTQNLHNDISNASRGNHYRNYKSLLNTERYLQLEIPLKYKTAFTKFRCSNHKLNIEVGRQLHIAYNLRICNFCFTENNMSIIDCEYHAFFSVK